MPSICFKQTDSAAKPHTSGSVDGSGRDEVEGTERDSHEKDEGIGGDSSIPPVDMPPEFNQASSTIEGMKVLQCIEWLRDRIADANLGIEVIEMVSFAACPYILA